MERSQFVRGEAPTIASLDAQKGRFPFKDSDEIEHSSAIAAHGL